PSREKSDFLFNRRERKGHKGKNESERSVLGEARSKESPDQENLRSLDSYRREFSKLAQILHRFQIADLITRFYVTTKRTKDTKHSEISMFQSLTSCSSRPSWCNVFFDFGCVVAARCELCVSCEYII